MTTIKKTPIVLAGYGVSCYLLLVVLYHMAENNTTVAGWLSDDFELKEGPYGQITGGRPRAKNYTLVVYPDDLPERAKDTWMGAFSSLGYKMAVSPLHDKDTNPDGEIKKAHWHVLLQGGTAWITIKTLRELVLTEFDGRGVAVPQSVSNVIGLMRYLVHLDNPEKFQYDKNDIRVFNGATVENAFALSKDDELAIRCDIIRYVQENEDILEYHQVVDTALQMSNDGDNAWIKALDNRSHMVESYIRSKRHAKFDAKKAELDYKEAQLEMLMRDTRNAIAKADEVKAKAEEAKAEDEETEVEQPFG